MLVWCLFAPPQGFGDFRVPVLGKKGLKAHLDLSPEAGPVAEVRSLRQQNPGCDRDFVSARATSSASTSRRMSPKLQQRSWGPSPVCVWLCRCPLQSPERYLVPQPRTWPWDLPLLQTLQAGGTRPPCSVWMIPGLRPPQLSPLGCKSLAESLRLLPPQTGNRGDVRVSSPPKGPSSSIVPAIRGLSRRSPLAFFLSLFLERLDS